MLSMRKGKYNMSNNVNVINNAGKDVVVTVNNNEGNTQIIIDLAGGQVELSSLKPGQTFSKNGVDYIVLNKLENDTAVIRNDLLADKIFDSDSNNWRTSSLRKYLNKEYLNKLEKDFGKENITTHEIDLLSLDGLADYGVSEDKVSLLTIDQYRTYRKVLGENKDRAWWLITPDSTPSGVNASYVRYVNSNGGVYCSDCFWGGKAVRPFFILRSSILVSKSK